MLPERAANLKTVAAKVGLAPCSVSAILNDTEAARAIPQATKDRVYRAAAELNYRPNFVARSLRTKRTRMVAVIAPGLGRSDVASVVASAQRRLHQSGYMLVLASCAGDNVNHQCVQFQQRGIEGIIAIDASVPGRMNMPVTFVQFGYSTSDRGVSSQLQARIRELGDAAAESIMQQVENVGSTQTQRLLAILPACAGMQSMDLGFSAAESA